MHDCFEGQSSSTSHVTETFTHDVPLFPINPRAHEQSTLWFLTLHSDFDPHGFEMEQESVHNLLMHSLSVGQSELSEQLTMLHVTKGFPVSPAGQ
uniref:Uncharacterized protein n=1 Tax=Lepeophtheirus salmonis TaxID=72036 RepID=A0A0K2TBT6_LEPSM